MEPQRWRLAAVGVHIAIAHLAFGREKVPHREMDFQLSVPAAQVLGRRNRAAGREARTDFTLYRQRLCLAQWGRGCGSEYCHQSEFAETADQSQAQGISWVFSQPQEMNHPPLGYRNMVPER